MSKETAELYLEKIAGIQDSITLSFSEGVSVIKAPNAVGKSSIIKGLELLLLDEKDLEGQVHYMNLFNQDFTTRARVKLRLNNEIIERSFSRGRHGLEPVGKPITPNGDRIRSICFVTPENQLIDDILSKRPIRNYVEQLAQSESYDHIVNFLDRYFERTERKARLFLNKISDLENNESRLNEKKNQSQSLEKGLSDLPEVSSSEVSVQDELYGRWSKKTGEISDVSREHSKNKGQITQLEYQLKSQNEELRELQLEINDLAIDSAAVKEDIKELTQENNQLEDEKSEISIERLLLNEELKLTNTAISKRKKFSQAENCFACGQPVGIKRLIKRQEDLRGRLHDLGVKEAEINGKIQIITEKIRKLNYDLQRMISRKDIAQNLSSDISGLERKIQGKKDEGTRLTRKLKKLRQEEEELGKNIDRSLREISNKRIELQARIFQIDSEIEAINDEIERLKTETQEYPVIKKRMKFIRILRDRVDKNKEQLLASVSVEFEAQVEAIQHDLGFTDLGKISIDTNDFRIKLKRVDERGVTISNWPLEALSTSERITLAVAFLIATKIKYAPEFPFFVLDELITSYDPGRFEKIKHYLKKIAPYVLITELASQEAQTEIEIVPLT